MPIAFGPWKSHHGDEVAIEFARAEGRVELLLAVKHPRRRFDRMPVGRDGRSLDDGPAERPLQHPQSAAWLKWIAGPAQDAAVAGLGGGRRPGNRAFGVETRFDRVILKLAPDGPRVAMQEPRPEKLADQEAHPAGGVKMVHVGFSIGINAGQKRGDLGKVGEILPSERDARGGRHRYEVNGEIGRAARRMKPDDPVDDGAFVYDAPDRRKFIAEGGDLQRPLDAEHGQRVAQRRIGIDEGGAGQVQAHDLHQHLVGVGRAVEGAGARGVIGFRFRGQQIGPRRLALCEELADLRLFVIGEPGGHGSCRQEQSRQMAERERADQEARHNLVADAEIDRRVEHIVRKGDRGRQRNDVARKKGKLHSFLALGDAVAHGGHAARDLSRRPHRARRLLDEIGKARIGLVG